MLEKKRVVVYVIHCQLQMEMRFKFYRTIIYVLNDVIDVLK